MNRYNLSDQKAISWLNRAEICVSFILRDLQIREVESLSPILVSRLLVHMRFTLARNRCNS